MIQPTSPILPPDANRLMTDNDYYVTENLLALRNTRIGNLMGALVEAAMPGASIGHAENGFEALVVIGQTAPGIVITDIMMRPGAMYCMYVKPPMSPIRRPIRLPKIRK